MSYNCNSVSSSRCHGCSSSNNLAVSSAKSSVCSIIIKYIFDCTPADDSCHCLSQEFSKEVEGKSSLKSSVVTEGNQLLRLKKVDTVVLRSDLARIDTQWTELLTRIPVVQEKLHQVSSHAARLNRLSCSRANRITPFCCFTRILKFHTMLPSNWQRVPFSHLDV